MPSKKKAHGHLTSSVIRGGMSLRKATPPDQIVRTLRITEHPAPEFFKDEGGKNHGLQACVKYEEMTKEGIMLPLSRASFFNVPLKVSLYYENYVKVEDQDQGILTFLGNVTRDTLPPITWEARTCQMKFRIGKVSRRKDGQRFRLYIEPDYDKADPGLDLKIHPAFTNPITVLSKRKLSAINDDNSSGTGRKRRRVSASPSLKPTGWSDRGRKESSSSRSAASTPRHSPALSPSVPLFGRPDDPTIALQAFMSKKFDAVNMTLNKLVTVMDKQSSRLSSLETDFSSLCKALNYKKRKLDLKKQRRFDSINVDDDLNSTSKKADRNDVIVNTARVLPNPSAQLAKVVARKKSGSFSSTYSSRTTSTVGSLAGLSDDDCMLPPSVIPARVRSPMGGGSPMLLAAPAPKIVSSHTRIYGLDDGSNPLDPLEHSLVLNTLSKSRLSSSDFEVNFTTDPLYESAPALPHGDSLSDYYL